MSMDHEVKDGGPAFPDIRYWDDGQMAVRHPGMSLRDWFAGQALAGMGTWIPYEGPSQVSLTQSYILHARAAWAYDQADAMLTARKGDAK